MRHFDTDFKAKGFSNSVGFGKRAALLVVDIINGFTDPKSPLGSEMEKEIESTNRLIDSVRLAGLPVYFSTIQYDEPDKSDAGIWIKKISGLKILARGSDQSAIDSRINRIASDTIISKKFASCFFGSSLLTQLVCDKIDTIILAGCTTSGCIRATAVDSCQYGYHTIIAKDAVGDRSDDAHEQSLADISMKYGDVQSVEEVIQNIKLLNIYGDNHS